MLYNSGPCMLKDFFFLLLKNQQLVLLGILNDLNLLPRDNIWWISLSPSYFCALRKTIKSFHKQFYLILLQTHDIGVNNFIEISPRELPHTVCMWQWTDTRTGMWPFFKFETCTCPVLHVQQNRLKLYNHSVHQSYITKHLINPLLFS